MIPFGYNSWLKIVNLILLPLYDSDSDSSWSSRELPHVLWSTWLGLTNPWSNMGSLPHVSLDAAACSQLHFGLQPWLGNGPWRFRASQVLATSFLCSTRGAVTTGSCLGTSLHRATTCDMVECQHRPDEKRRDRAGPYNKWIIDELLNWKTHWLQHASIWFCQWQSTINIF